MSSEVSLIPTGGNGCWGGEAMAAGLGGLIGGAIGGGWGNGGWGNRGNYAGTCVGNATGFAENAVLNSLNDIQTGVTNLGMNLIQGQGRNDLTACQGFSGINAQILNQTNWQNQGFAGLNTAIVRDGYENRLAVEALARQMAECCCQTKQEIAANRQAIVEVGCSIKDQLKDQTIAAQAAKIVELTGANSELRQREFVTASQTAQTANIIAHVRAMIPTTTTPTTPAATA